MTDTMIAPGPAVDPLDPSMLTTYNLKLKGYGDLDKPKIITEVQATPVSFDHVMVDIETMGNESYSAILSIAAIKFDINTGQCGDTFYELVDLQSCVDAGLVINPSTVKWWMKQNEAARLELANAKGKPIFDTLLNFSTFLKGGTIFINPEDAKQLKLWGNSARFDLGILQNAYNKFKMQIPWDFRKERDIRTLVSLAPEVRDNYIHTGDAHNALDDCYNQIGYCSKIWQKLLHYKYGLTSLN